MGYKMVVKKADGSTEVTSYDPNGDRRIITKETDGSYGAILAKKGKKPRKVAYNFGPMFGGTLSKKDRVDEINRGLGRLRAAYRSTGGMSKAGTSRHKASIPPEIYYSAIAEDGPDSVRDPKYMEKLISDHGLVLSSRRR